MEGTTFLSIPVPYIHTKYLMRGETMERVVMPELITPALTEIMNSRPEILDLLLGNANNEEIIGGRDLEFNSENMPKTLKFLFCNIRINIGESHDTGWEAPDGQTCRADIRLMLERLKSLELQLDEKNRRVGTMLSDVISGKEKLLILETRIREGRKALKLASSAAGNRKLAYRYKMDIKAMINSLENERHAFAAILNAFEHEKKALDSLNEQLRKMNGSLYDMLIKGEH